MEIAKFGNGLVLLQHSSKLLLLASRRRPAGYTHIHIQ